MLKKFFKYALAGITVAFSFLAWFSVDRAINVPEISVLVNTIIWFTLYFISFSLCAILIKRRYIIELLALATLISSFFLVSSWYHAFAIALGFLILTSAIGRIRKDLKLNIKVDTYKTLRTGSTSIVLSLAIILASQYYFTIRNYSFDTILSQFKMESAVNALTSRLLSSIDPNLKDINNENMTVDEFILKTQNERINNDLALENMNDLPVDQIIDAQIGKKLTGLQRETLKQEYLKKITQEQTKIQEQGQALVLEESRKKISELSGLSITGSEKMSDVFSQMINSKIASYFSPSINEANGFPIFPAILAMLIFLTVLPVGSFLTPAWLIISKLIFRVLVKAELVRIDKIPVEMEIIN